MTAASMLDPEAAEQFCRWATFIVDISPKKLGHIESGETHFGHENLDLMLLLYMM